MIAALLFLRKNWKLALAGLGALLMISVYFYVSHLQHVARAQKAKAQQATEQARVQVIATKADDQIATVTAKSQEHSHVVIQRIQAVPGADTPIPDAALAEWRRGMSNGPAAPPY